jgi:hypothetical protein
MDMIDSCMHSGIRRTHYLPFWKLCVGFMLGPCLELFCRDPGGRGQEAQ